MKIVIYIYNGMTMLDAIGPYEVLRSMEGVEIIFAARKKGEVRADSHLVSLQAKHRIQDIAEADILLIPGSTIAFIKEVKNKKVLNWIREIDATTRFTTSVCTGSIILAATGLLQGRKATSHWKTVSRLQDYQAVPLKERIVKDDKYVTAAGVSAGIDLGLFLVQQIKGVQAAKAAQLAIEYDPSPAFDCGTPAKCDEETIALAEKQLERDARHDLSMWDKLTHLRQLRKLK